MGSRVVRLVVLAAALTGCGDEEPATSSEAAASMSSTASSGGAGGAGGASSSSSGGSTSSSGGAAVEPDFSCEGVPWPATAPDPIQVGGVVYDTNSNEPLAGATVTVLSIDDGAILATTTSDADGKYTVTLATGGEALAIYERVETAGYVTSYTYPPYAFWQDEPQRNLPALSVRDRGGMGDPTKGLIVLNARDCAGDAVAGAAVAFSPESAITGYVDDAGLHLSDTTSAGGILVAIDAPAGPQEPTVTFAGHTWRSWPIEVFAGSMVYTPRRP